MNDTIVPDGEVSRNDRAEVGDDSSQKNQNKEVQGTLF